MDFGRMDLQDKVKGLVDDINLIDYVDRTELQILKDTYVHEMGQDYIDSHGIDSYEFANFLDEQDLFAGSTVFEKFDEYLQELLDSRLIYTSECIELLQSSLLDSFEILDKVNAEGLIELTSFDVDKMAWAVAYWVCYNEIRSDLEFAFIDNALGELK